MQARPRDIVGWHDARVLKCNSNGSVHVRYESNGKVERFVPRSLIRKAYASRSVAESKSYARSDTKYNPHAPTTTLKVPAVRRDLFGEPQCEAKNCTAHALYVEEFAAPGVDNDECAPAIAMQTQKRMWCTKHKPSGALYVGDACIARLLDIPHTHTLQRGMHICNWGDGLTHDDSHLDSLFVFDGSSFSSFQAKPLCTNQLPIHLTFAPVPMSSPRGCVSKSNTDTTNRGLKGVGGGGGGGTEPTATSLATGVETKTSGGTKPRSLSATRSSANNNSASSGKTKTPVESFPQIVPKASKATSSGMGVRPPREISAENKIKQTDVSGTLQVRLLFGCVFKQVLSARLMC